MNNMFANICTYLFGPKKSSAAIAKERLQIIVAHERTRDMQNKGDFDLQSLQNEIILVIAKHLKINQEHVKVQLIERDRQRSSFELNVDLPDTL